MLQENPFIIEGYVSPQYFCDRESETAFLVSQIVNGNNVALIAQRRLGKSGLIQNVFHQEEIKSRFCTFYVDIYDTKNLSEFVNELGKSILRVLKSRGERAWDGFLNVLTSLKHTITFNSNGFPEWGVKIGDISNPDATLDEIFTYLERSSIPCVVAIDEFQVIAGYPEKTVEATLRKRIQNCHNARFIYSGSQRHMMSMIFASPSRPFYNSSTMMGLDPIDKDVYLAFANDKLATDGKSISGDAFAYLYDKFDGVTWYIQYVLNMLYMTKVDGFEFAVKDVDRAIDEVLRRNSFIYSSLLYQLTTKQKQLLLAFSAEGVARNVMSQAFLQKYKMGASTVQTSIKALLDRDFITQNEDGDYMVYDKFFSLWLQKRA